MQESVFAALRDGDPVAAVRVALDWVKSDRANPEAHHTLGLALRQQGDVRGALAAFNHAIELAPERSAFHLSRALLAAQMGVADQARVGFVQALQHDPNQLMAYLGLADLALNSAQPEQAEQHLRFAERIAPEHPHVEALWAQLQLTRGEGAAALRRMQFASQRVPNDATVLGVLGLCYLNQRHFAFAEQALRRALEMQPRQRMLRYALVDALISQDRYDDAALEADILVEQNPSDVRALTLVGQIAADRGDTETAVARLGESLRQVPAQPAALDPLLAVYLARGESDAAQAFLEGFLAQNPQLDFAWGALIKLQGEDIARAAGVALRWVEARPDSATAAEAAAQLVEAQGDAAQAESLALRAIERAPHSVGANLVLVRKDMAAGAANAACERLASLRAALVDPALQPMLAAWHAHACEAAGRLDEAAQHWAVANPEFDPGAPPTLQ
jgi:Flp pilus assembly protein TadD